MLTKTRAINMGSHHYVILKIKELRHISPTNALFNGIPYPVIKILDPGPDPASICPDIKKNWIIFFWNFYSFQRWYKIFTQKNYKNKIFPYYTFYHEIIF